jgi:5-methyltetrahydrofolate--homocysteine methyltransferase
MNRLLEALHSGRVVLMDGAMGTELQRLGLAEGEPSDLWNLTHPEKVCAVHRANLEAGAEVLLTNTFQANPDALARHGLQTRLADIWQAALANACIFREPSLKVLADIGPFVGKAVCRELFEHCKSADGLLLETWNVSQGEGTTRWIAMMASHFGRPRLPLLISYAYRRDDEQLRATARNCVSFAVEVLQPCAVGANCGVEIDMDDLLEIVRVYRGETDLPIFVRPNAGTPTRTPNGWEYPRSPEYMADKLWPLLEAGVTMVGGCCGTTPAHIAAFRRVVDEWNARQAKK